MLWATAFIGIAITGFGPLWREQYVVYENAIDTLGMFGWVVIYTTRSICR